MCAGMEVGCCCCCVFVFCKRERETKKEHEKNKKKKKKKKRNVFFKTTEAPFFEIKYSVTFHLFFLTSVLLSLLLFSFYSISLPFL